MSLQRQHFSPQLNLKTLSVGLGKGLNARPLAQKPSSLPTEPTGRRLTFFAFPTLGNLTKNLGPRVGDVCFFCAEEWDQVTPSHLLVCAPAILEVPVWRLKAFQSGLVPSANNLYPIHVDGLGALSCIAQHVRLFVSVRLMQ